MSLKRKVYIVFSWALTLLILSFIFSLSAQNAEESKELSDSLASKILQWIQIYIDGELIRKFAHMIEFAALSFSLGNSINATWKTENSKIMAFAITVLCAAGDEIHQIFVPGRAFQTSDILVDSLGALIGVLVWIVLLKIISKTGKRGNKDGSIETV